MYKVLAFLILIIGFEYFCYSQGLQNNPDELLRKAQQLAYSNHWKEARDTARLILQINEKNYDARILIGRTYAWEHQYDSARIEIKKVLAIDSSYRDAIDAMIDIEFWSGNLANAINYCDTGLKFYPDDKDFLLKKARILMAMGKENEARSILAELLNINPNGYEVNSMVNNLKKYHNQVNVDHTFDYYRIPSLWRWHMTSLQYQLNSKYGVFIGKLNLGELVQTGETYLPNLNEQFEIEAYPIINPTTYFYADYGYSWRTFFPLHRFGLEPFKTLPDNWEVSGGFRLLVIKQSPSNAYIPIITGSVGKYFSGNWVSFRPFITFSPNNETSLAAFLFYRHYLGIADNYIGGMAGYGVSPDDKYNDSGQFEHFNSDSYHLRFDVQHRITKRFLFRFMSEFIYEEYLSGIYHFRFVNDLYLMCQF